MKLFASYKYQLRDMARGAGIFYLVVILLVILGAIMTIAGGNGRLNMPFDGISCVFLFVMGLCTFKEYFLYLTQNGVSRRCFFLSKLLAMVTICAAMAVIDSLLTLVCSAVLQGAQYEFTQLFSLIFPGTDLLPNMVFAICLNLMCFACGSFITIMFYRLNKIGKVIVGAGVPTLLFIGLPILTGYATITRPSLVRSLGEAILSFLTWMAQGLGRFCLVLLVAAALLMALTWLLERRAVVKAK